MKKLLFTTAILIVAITTTTHAQFVLTPEGMRVNGQDDYLVLEIEGMDQKQLYKKTLLFINQQYKSPKDVMSTVEPVAITINGNQPNAIKRNSMHSFDMNYSLNMQFKDGKIRVNVPDFKLTNYTSSAERQTLHVQSANSFFGTDLGIYNPKGKLKSERAKKDLEEFFNAYMVLYKEFITTEESW
jgi:hypothetical protein